MMPADNRSKQLVNGQTASSVRVSLIDPVPVPFPINRALAARVEQASGLPHGRGIASPVSTRSTFTQATPLCSDQGNFTAPDPLPPPCNPGDRAGRPQGRPEACSTERGVTLIELLIAVTLVALLSVAILLALRVGLNAMGKANAKLLANRRVASVERILTEQVEDIIPTSADCRSNEQLPPTRISFFEGEGQSMRFVSTYSLQDAGRGQPKILEFQVIPGENGVGARLIVNERLFSGPRSAGDLCIGLQPDFEGKMAPTFRPIEAGAGSFVLADKLAYCRFEYEGLLPPPQKYRWTAHWTRNILPAAIRVEMAPLVPNAAELQLVSLALPVRITRQPLSVYEQ